MRGWQFALIVASISLSQVALAILYMRPRAIARAGGRRYSSWRLLLAISAPALLVALLLLLLPENLWWNP